MAITHQENRVSLVEFKVSKFGLAHRTLFRKFAVLVDVQIIDIHLIQGGSGKYCGRVRSPDGIDHGHGEVEAQHGGHDFGVPNFDRPIRTGGNEGSGMEVIPTNLIHGQ